MKLILGTCNTCRYDHLDPDQGACGRCGAFEKWRKKSWRQRLLHRFLVVLVVGVIVFSMYTCVGRAAGLEDGEADGGGYTMAVTVDDISAVNDQLDEMDAEMDMLAQLVYAEARGVDSKAEQAAVIWCALNRVDTGYWGDTISSVVRARSQFAYSSGLPVKDELRSLAQDVVTRWLLEKRGVADVGRTLPSEYCYFAGRGGHNHFRYWYSSKSKNYDGTFWDWSLPDPYAVEEK